MWRKESLYRKGYILSADIQLRIKALFGIIISDTNPNRPKLNPMQFSLTSENLEEVVAEIKRAGYFADPVLAESNE